jgi:hypothetical protein
VSRLQHAWGNLDQFGREVAWFLAVTLTAAVVLVFALLGVRDETRVPVTAEVGHGSVPVVVPVELVQLLRGDVGSGPVEGASGSGAPRASSTAFELARCEAGIQAEVGVASSSAPLSSVLTPADAFAQALASSPWPRHLWPTLTEIARCESQFDPSQVGDSGRSFGALQVHAPAWPRLVRSFDLLDLSDNLAAAWIVYIEAGHSFEPWSCWRGR